MSDSFVPGPDTERAFRDALGRFATGVTVVTIATPQGPVGMTVNSFSSVSLDPPLILWSPSKSCNKFSSFASAPHFAVHVLHAHQRDLSDLFASRGDQFDAGWQQNGHGVPTRADCLCRLDCETVATHDAGDHLLVIGKVANAVMMDGEPLVFCHGTYGGFQGSTA